MISILIALAGLSPAWSSTTIAQLEAYRCRFRDGRDLREVLAHGRLITAENLGSLRLEGPLEIISGERLQMFELLRLFAQATGENLILSPDVARLTVTLPYGGEATLKAFAERLWDVFKQKELLVVDDGRYIRVLAPCRLKVQDF